MHTQLKAVIFDFAGTVVDYGCQAPTMVFVEAFAANGVDITVAEAREPMGIHKRDHIRAIAKMPRVAAAWEATHGQACTEADVEAMFQSFIPRQIEVIGKYATLIPGALETLQYCREHGIKVGGCTGYMRSMLDALLPLMAAQGFVPDSSVGGDEVPAGRPAPWSAVQNALQLDAWPLSACVKVGDTVADIAEGRNAGMWTIGISKTGNLLGLTEAEVKAMSRTALLDRIDSAAARLNVAGADYIVESVAALPVVLRQIEARIVNGERPQ